jgi:hypothetical protein
MRKSAFLKLLTVVAALGAAAVFHTVPAMADTVTYTTSLQSGNMCTGCGPFGTISVSSVSGQPDELSVTLTLAAGEVFASSGAGAALLFDINGNPSLSVETLLPTGFTFSQPSSPIMADGSGKWNTEIVCAICGNGTSPPQSSGPISFILVSSGPLTPLSFVTNNNGNLFASDIGVPKASGGFFTGDVVTSGPLTPVPLPATAWLMISGLSGLGALIRKRKVS